MSNSTFASGHDWARCRLGALLICLALVACGKEKPAPHTPEYRAAHGIVEGEANTIEVSGTTFRVPNDVEFEVYSSGDIHPGKADELTLRLFIDQAGIHKGNPVPVARDSRVRVEISKMGDPNGKSYFEGEKERAEAPIARPSMELIEYPLKVPAAQAEHSGTSVYVAADGVRGNGREFYCSVGWPKDPAKTNGSCRAYYFLTSGLMVQVFFEYSALANWNVIMSEVRREVESIEK
ncbi:hypothetical protein [Pseudomonas sp. zfem005]|uniref:hypothetical protein n=1 Tax=Pseudomonas sp. zfem005 TaxID=3078200 RepID=UPI00292980A9|nr:hypothetical protein [Pseudomonas sp. zfem005]MDU9416753.1 hypothetical protein [Pseudomonas sp. zfem005]